MKILALEFSSNERSVAVAERLSDGSVKIHGAVKEDFRGVTGLTLVDRVLKEAGLNAAEISEIVIGLGPGSYTGIRSAIAIALGWQLGRDVKVVGVSSAISLAEEAKRRGLQGEVIILIDAQRGDVYLQKVRLDPAGCTEVDELRIVSREAIPTDATIIGPEASKFTPAGQNISPPAEILATLLDRARSCPAEQLEPIYLREISFVKAPPSRQIQ